jgi:phosphate/sulfate permease
MNFVLSTASALSATLYLVAMFKLAFPAATSRVVVGCALASGIAVSFLVGVAQATPLTLQNCALCLLGGIAAAAGAAGVRGTDNKADEIRERQSNVNSNQ